MDTETKDLLSVARSGAKAVYDFNGPADVDDSKAGGEIVSAYDYEASKAMNRTWAETSLAHIPVIDEERPETHALLDHRDGQLKGMLDPIDGTAVILRTLLASPQAVPGWYGSTLALMRDGVVTHAVMVLLGHRQLFFGARNGVCSWMTGSDFDDFIASGELRESYPRLFVPRDDDRGHKLNIAISASSKMSEQLFDHHVYLLRCIRTGGLLGNELALGCAVGNVSAVIFGHADFYVNAGSGVAWDLAGPFLLAELAGCVCTTIRGGTITWDSKPQSVICARNKSVHRRVLVAVNPFAPPTS